jgi:hypothetical protein
MKNLNVKIFKTVFFINILDQIYPDGFDFTSLEINDLWLQYKGDH